MRRDSPAGLTVGPWPLDRPLNEQVRQRLLEGISAGEWGAGTAIPTESALAAAFGVAIGTIRKAVDGLVAEGLLVRRQGKGTFVTAHDSGRLLFYFFHIVTRDGKKTYPEVRTIDFRRATADQNHVLARLHGPRTQELNGRTFHHPVGRVRAGSNAAELNQSDGRQFGHTISSYDAEMIQQNAAAEP